MNQLITSPAGTIVFSRLRNTGDGTVLNLRFDGTTDQEKEFKAAIAEVNPSLIGTKSKKITKEGQFTVQAKSKYQPQVIDSTGNLLNETEDGIPSISSGTASMVVKPGTSEKGNYINLVTVVLGNDIEIWTGDEESAAERRARIEEAMKNLNIRGAA